MIIFRNCQTVNNKFVDLHDGDKVSAYGGNGKHYSGLVGNPTTVKWRRDVIEDADLESNYFRISKVNGVSFM